jgi:DNA polymerase III delta subunit
MSITLLHGNHSFTRKIAKNKIIQNYRLSKSENISFIKINETANSESQNQLKQKLTTGSLFTQEELVVVTFLDAAKTSRKKKINFATFDSIVPFLASVSEDITLLLDVPVKLPVAGKLLKTIKKIGGEIRLFELTAAKGKDAVRTAIREFLAQEKISIDWYLLNQLVDFSQGDWWYVFSALDQAALLLKSLDKKQDDDQVAKLWDIPEEQSIFRLFDAIGNGDQAGAFSLLYEKMGKDKTKTGTDVESVLGFTSLMARQLRQMLAVKEGISQQEAQREWFVPGFAYGKLKFQAANFSEELLKEAYWKLTEIQEKAKSGLLSPLSLIDFFVIYLISKRQRLVGNKG